MMIVRPLSMIVIMLILKERITLLMMTEVTSPPWGSPSADFCRGRVVSRLGSWGRGGY